MDFSIFSFGAGVAVTLAIGFAVYRIKKGRARSITLPRNLP